MTTNPDRNRRPAVLRGYIVAERLVAAHRSLSAAELAAEVGLSVPATARVLEKLEQEGLVQRAAVPRRYLPGPRLCRFVIDVMSNQVLGAKRHIILEDLAKQTGETCTCALLQCGRTVVFDRVDVDRQIRIDMPTGSNLHCSAGGKLFLANMDERRRNSLVEAAPLRRFTERTIIDGELLLREIQRVSTEQVGVEDEEFMAGIVSLAVPVNDTMKNDIRFALAVHAPKMRRSLQCLRRFVPYLQQAAADMAACHHDDRETGAISDSRSV